MKNNKNNKDNKDNKKIIDNAFIDNECLNDDEYNSSEGFICPKCGRKFKDRSNEMGGYCLECYQNNEDL